MALGRWLVRLGAAAVLVAGNLIGAAPAGATPVRGPVIASDFPDPAIARDGSTYYLFSTNTGYGNVPVARSSDLNTWTRVGDALPRLPSWASGGFTWAPAVTTQSSASTGTTWVLYYAARHAASGRQCIGRATATAASGPYVDSSTAPLMCQLDRGGSIDPAVLVAGDGSRWLFWKSDDNAIGQAPHVWSQQLTADGLALVGAANDLLTVDQAWEDPVVEGPQPLLAGGRLLLLYSGGWWESAGYGVGYASCASARGPCAKQTTAGPWIGPGDGLSGPGGASVADTIFGTLALAFHGWTRGVGYANGGVRSAYVEPLDVRDGVPVLRPDRPRQGPIAPYRRWLLQPGVRGGAAAIDVAFGDPGMIPVAGRWSPGPTDGIGVYRNGTWYLRPTASSGAATTFAYGYPGAIPVVGDWDGDGVDGIGVYDSGWWYLRNTATPGPPDLVVHYGYPGAIPVVGDWDGNGTDGIGVYDSGWWFLRETATPGSPQRTVSYGYPGAIPVVGDWDGNGTDGIGVYDSGWWFLRETATPGAPQRTVDYGWAGYVPVPGQWSSGGGDGIGVVLDW